MSLFCFSLTGHILTKDSTVTVMMMKHNFHLMRIYQVSNTTLSTSFIISFNPQDILHGWVFSLSHFIPEETDSEIIVEVTGRIQIQVH